MKSSGNIKMGKKAYTQKNRCINISINSTESCDKDYIFRFVTKVKIKHIILN